MNNNRFFYEKLKERCIEFGTSAFQLMHVTTQKYLSLTRSKSDQLQYEYTDVALRRIDPLSGPTAGGTEVRVLG